VIVVIGLGRETRQLLPVLAREHPDTEVVVLDERDVADEERPQVAGLRLTVVGGVDLDDPGAVPDAADAVYRSPGVSPYRAALAGAVARDVPVTTPTGWWAARRDGADVVAITGTKGKSTTSALTAHLLRWAGRDVALLGNIGRSALDADAPASEVDDTVLELSSYQLADLDAPIGLAGITTLLRDHVPWHGSLARYHADKLRLLRLAGRTIVTAQVAAHPAVRELPAPGHVDAVTCPSLRDEVRTALAAAGLVGEHLVHDAELALALFDARLEAPGGVADLVPGLRAFEPLPHRLTPVRERDGVLWVDDSISTVPESAVAAVSAHRTRGPVTVLLGGDDRGQDLAPLAALLRDPDVRAVVLPPLGDRLAATLRPVAADRVDVADDLAGAVERAAEVTPAGGAVVLSPAAPSFSSYRDFVARGDHFVALVQALP
jgi:UDP-N-acetylmuramoyl-L-alanine---L-glutamate ligase